MEMPGGRRCYEEKLKGKSSQRATLDTKKREDVTEEVTSEQKLKGGRECQWARQRKQWEPKSMCEERLCMFMTSATRGQGWGMGKVRRRERKPARDEDKQEWQMLYNPGYLHYSLSQ